MADKTHPDDVMIRVAELAKSLGYGIVSAELVSLRVNQDEYVGLPPRHIYRTPDAGMTDEN